MKSQPRRDLTDLEIERLFAAIDPDDTFADRDRALMRFMFHTGLRVGELTSLTVRQVSHGRLVRRELSFRGKGGSRDVLPLNRTARLALRDILQFNERHGFSLEGDTPLLFNQWRVPMGVRGVQLLFQKLRERAGLDVPASPHWARHTMATRLMQGCQNLRVVQELLRHKSLRHAEVYTHPSRHDERVAVCQIG